jgi:long-chain acyl-CoA synthetase
VIVQSEYVAQCFVYGDSLKSKLVAIIVPDFEILEPYAKDQGIKGDQDALCANDKINATILEDIKAKGKVNKLRGFEFVVKISLSSEPFTVQNDLITPTFKAKRPQLKKRYAAEIDAMYEGID